MTTLRNFHILDDGRPGELRFTIWAEATETDDTSKVASAFICSTDTRENAEMIVTALREVVSL